MVSSYGSSTVTSNNDSSRDQIKQMIMNKAVSTVHHEKKNEHKNHTQSYVKTSTVSRIKDDTSDDKTFDNNDDDDVTMKGAITKKSRKGEEEEDGDTTTTAKHPLEKFDVTTRIVFLCLAVLIFSYIFEQIDNN
jgi:hypothetical protein